MPRKRTISGTMLQHDDPVWEPLVAAVGGHHAVWFMWMCEVELVDGTRVHVYKHSSTRRSLHLDEDGRAFVYLGDKQYREIDPEIIIDLVLNDFEPDDDP